MWKALKKSQLVMSQGLSFPICKRKEMQEMIIIYFRKGAATMEMWWA